MPKLPLEFLLAAGQLAELALSVLQLLAQALQFLLPLGDLLLEVAQRDSRHGGVTFGARIKGDSKSPRIKVVIGHSAFQGLGKLRQENSAGSEG